MYTDMVGYTALSQENESLALDSLQKHRQLLRPLFSKHAGREVKTMGDGFLVEFGSALEATLCAIDIQNTIHSRNLERGEKLQVRIGIHVGDVVHQGEDVLGDAVNIASRIEPLAKGGGICITEQVFAQVRNKVPYELVKLPPRELKNVAFKVETYMVELPWEKAASASESVHDMRRLAVLPFSNISPDPNDEYFADGLTEELISAMSGLQGLQVIARTSVMNYKKKEKNVSEIGKELRVGTVLEGSVRKAGNKVRVTAQLIDVTTESHLWSEKYDRELDDIFKIQDDISGKIAQALKVRLVPVPTRTHAESIDAYTFYLKGRFLWNRRDREGVLASLKMFQEAIKIDPYYAKAYAGLADAYHIAATYDFMDWTEGLAKSNEAAMKSLELDDTLAEAHASRGANLETDLRYDEAQGEYLRATDLNPSYATAHQWRSEILREMGKMDEAMEEIEEARELDPLSTIIACSVGLMQHMEARFDEAIATYGKVIADEPNFANAYLFRAFCYAYKRMKEQAYSDLEAWNRLSRIEDAYKCNLVVFKLWFGEIENASSMIEELIPKVGKPGVWEMDIATCYAILGDRDEFFNWVDKAISAKKISPAWLRYSPTFDKVRSDSHFPEVFRKLGLPY